MRIPLAQLGSQGPTEKNDWRFNAARHLPTSIAPGNSSVLVTNGTYDITASMQNSARLIPGPREGFPKVKDTDGAREDGQF